MQKACRVILLIVRELARRKEDSIKPKSFGSAGILKGKLDDKAFQGREKSKKNHRRRYGI